MMGFAKSSPEVRDLAELKPFQKFVYANLGSSFNNGPWKVKTGRMIKNLETGTLEDEYEIVTTAFIKSRFLEATGLSPARLEIFVQQKKRTFYERRWKDDDRWKNLHVDYKRLFLYKKTASDSLQVHSIKILVEYTYSWIHANPAKAEYAEHDNGKGHVSVYAEYDLETWHGIPDEASLYDPSMMPKENIKDLALEDQIRSEYDKPQVTPKQKPLLDYSSMDLQTGPIKITSSSRG